MTTFGIIGRPQLMVVQQIEKRQHITTTKQQPVMIHTVGKQIMELSLALHIHGLIGVQAHTLIAAVQQFVTRRRLLGVRTIRHLMYGTMTIEQLLAVQIITQQ